ncbi:FAD-binding oxidoreductase [Pelomonas sp. KK5]|uniref:NAD(P)/FAD-dependent oxidoreductase n=1 Tax=Pelomonas sp. KK5 TaxID=1855730 RepID=UPI00097C417B|nr:FAD-binding oxidoreductase [Pelomonas sp. KK5]
MSLLKEFDFIVIGAGMAGASVAAPLSRQARVAVLEAEQHAGMHSTGRSAALYSALYGNPVIRALTRASRSFFFDTPPGFSEVPLVVPRDTLYFARPDQAAALAAFRACPDIAAATFELTGSRARERLPVFLPDYLGSALVDTGSADIDVDALHQAFLRQARTNGAQVCFDHAVKGLRSDQGRWFVETTAGTLSAPVVINAAGAWGDGIARLAGVAPVGLEPRRRTAVLVDVPEAHAPTASSWPAAIDIDEMFYFKPDAGLMLLSPADEHPSPPCDAQPEELDIAIAVDRFEQATGVQVRRVRHRWAGLRVFSPDGVPVVGFDPVAPGFFWLVGQGGYGIQTAPAMGRAAACLATGQPLPADILAAGVTPAMLAKTRLL